MKKIEVGQTIQILANVGVLAGIVMLGLELRQNNEFLGLQIRNNIYERIIGSPDIVLENPYLLELLGKDVATLSETERDALVVLGIRTLAVLETGYRDAVRGFGDEEQLRRGATDLWNRPRLNYGMPLAWDAFKARASPEFVAWMEENVIKREGSTGNSERVAQ
jgi:hypothetical protein